MIDLGIALCSQAAIRGSGSGIRARRCTRVFEHRRAGRVGQLRDLPVARRASAPIAGDDEEQAAPVSKRRAALSLRPRASYGRAVRRRLESLRVSLAAGAAAVVATEFRQAGLVRPGLARQDDSSAGRARLRRFLPVHPLCAADQGARRNRPALRATRGTSNSSRVFRESTAFSATTSLIRRSITTSTC